MSYQAFISYSHQGDVDYAAAVQEGLQRLAKPWYRLRAIRVFRDKTSLPVNPGLWSHIQNALTDSEYFVLIASPRAAASRWVRKEAEHWMEKRDPRKFLIVLIAGELVWDATAGDFDWKRSTALPESLRGRLTEEPLFLDLRWVSNREHLSLQNPRFRNAVAELAAAVRSIPKDELVGEDVRQHRRMRQLAWSAVILLTVLAATASLSAVLAYLQRAEAFRQRERAQENAREATHQKGIAEVNASEATRQKGIAEENAAEARRQAMVALTQSRIAQQQRDTALSRLMAARSLRNVYNPRKILDLALLQSVVANQIEPTAEAQESLSTALIATNRIRKFVHTPDTIVSMAVSPDGRTIAIGHFHGQIILWDTATLKARLTLENREGRGQVVQSVSFSPDGGTLASASGETIILWDVTSGTRRGVLSGEQHGRVSRLAWHPDGATLVSNRGGSILLWDVHRRRLRATLPAHRNEVVALTLSPGGATIASAAYGERGIRLWNTETLEQLRLLDGHQGQVKALGFNSDGTQLASGGADSAIITWDVVSGRERARFDKQTDRVDVVAFHPNGRQLVSGSLNGVIAVWDMATSVQQELLFGHTNGVLNLVFTRNGTELVSSAFNDTFMVWSMGKSWQRTYLTGHERGVRTVKVSPDGVIIASAGDDGTVRLWNAATGEQRAILKGHRGTVKTVAFHENGRILASGGADDRKIIFWDIASSRRLGEVDGNGSVTSVAFSRDGRWLASAAEDSGSISLRDPANGQQRSELPGHDGGVQALEFSRDSKILVSGGRDGSVRVWDLQTKKQKVAPRNAGGVVIQLALSPEGRFVATSASFRGLVLLWNTFGSGRPFEIESSPGVEHSIAFSPDGKTFACTSAELALNIFLWNPENHKQRGMLETPATTQAITFTPDGKYLVTGHSNGYIGLWDVDVDGWQKRACEIANRNLTREEWNVVVSEDLSYRAVCPELPLPK